MAILSHTTRKSPWWGGWAVLGLLLILDGDATAQVPREYQLKAVFLWRFAEFVRWPPGRFVSETSPLVIGVLGENPFGPALEIAVRNQTAQGRPIVVRHYSSVAAAAQSHILFISASEQGRLARLLSELGPQGVLTVSDLPGFAEQGGMIELGLAQNRIQLRVNWEAAKQAGLAISPRLLKSAEIVRRGD